MYSKSAIGHATASLAHELLPLGVRVNGIAPGLFITEMSAPGTINAVGQSHIPEGKTFSFEVPVSAPIAPGQQPAGRSKDIAALVLFMVANWFVDGETVLIDGGVSDSSSSLEAYRADALHADPLEASVLILGSGAWLRCDGLACEHTKSLNSSNMASHLDQKFNIHSSISSLSILEIGTR